MLKQKICEMVNTTSVSSKSYGKIISCNPQLKGLADTYMKDHGIESYAELAFCIFNDVLPVKCPCGSKALFNTFNKGYRKFCSLSCPEKGKVHATKIKDYWAANPELLEDMLVRKKNTNIERYGVPNAMMSGEVQHRLAQSNLVKYGSTSPLNNPDIRQKVKKTTLAKYGVEYPFQSKEIRNKAVQTYITNHGHINDMSIPRQAFKSRYGKNPFSCDWVNGKVKQTLIATYGVDHPSKSSEIAEQKRVTLNRNYGKDNPAQLHVNPELYSILMSSEKLEALLRQSTLSAVCDRFNVSRSLIINHHNRHGLDIIKQRARSGYEEEIAKILGDNGITFTRNYSKLCYPLQVDFYIPDHKLAIEFNGLYWHSEKSGSKSKDYHASKTKKCSEHGIQLLTIFEDEWLERQQVIVNKVLHLCGKTTQVIGARKIQVTETRDFGFVKTFLEKYHLQGKTEGISHAYIGKVMQSGEIVAVVTIRKVKDNEYEMTRFCTHNAANYPGLFSKFLKHIHLSLVEMQIMTTFADLRWSAGDVYEKSGFVKCEVIKPDYCYTDYHTREHKFNLRKNKIRVKYNVDIIGKTEKMLADELGLDRIWDCGKIKYQLTFSQLLHD